MRRKILSFVYIFSVFWVNPIIGVTWGVSTRRPRALPKRFSLRDHSLTRKMWISRARILFHPCEPHKLKKNYINNILFYLNILLVVTIFTAKTRRKFGLFTMVRISYVYCDVQGSAPKTPPCSVTTFCYSNRVRFGIIWLSQDISDSVLHVENHTVYTWRTS